MKCVIIIYQFLLSIVWAKHQIALFLSKLIFDYTAVCIYILYNENVKSNLIIHVENLKTDWKVFKPVDKPRTHAIPKMFRFSIKIIWFCPYKRRLFLSDIGRMWCAEAKTYVSTSFVVYFFISNLLLSLSKSKKLQYN